MPIAFERSSRGNVFEMIESVEGMIIAPPTPISERTTISPVLESTKSTARLERPKIATPSWSASRRPKRSPKAPNVSSRPAKTSR